MKKIFLAIFAAVLLVSCSTAKVEVTITNNLGIDRENEIVEISKNTIW